jgi:hypothetical protein
MARHVSRDRKRQDDLGLRLLIRDADEWMSSVRESVGLAIEYVQYALITAQGKGQGNGPLNHQCLTIPRTLAL